ncbi:MAG: glycosyltransferase family 4 protein [Lentimicrobium sp.]|jgi:glycosyltransferase involved in cell wall biosynthesis|nr:glycosyltransferase family 4 protein [Lentimicrobium sp.]
MTKVLLVAPLNDKGNGGILSWTRRFVKTFHSEDFEIVPIKSSSRSSNNAINPLFIKRLINGLLDLRDTRKNLINAIKQDEIHIMHITTSGGLGTFRDYVLAKVCKRKGIRTIMHCHYGSMTESLKRNDILGYFLSRTLKLYDHIWVLDMRTLTTLKSIHELRDKAFLTPNSIEVHKEFDTNLKSFTKIAFIGNLVPSKGLFELVEAITKVKYNIELTIIGPGTKKVIDRIKEIAGEYINKRIKIMGVMPNNEAVSFLNSVDILALPTYYPAEAFPMSILEAMSLGKLVISTPRAAIQDMLTLLNGDTCGILVREKSVDDIVIAIEWCITNPRDANNICEKAYKKVYETYRTDIVYKLYEENYRKLI